MPTILKNTKGNITFRWIYPHRNVKSILLISYIRHIFRQVFKSKFFV